MQARRTLIRPLPSVTVMVSPSPIESTVEACAGAARNNRVDTIKVLAISISLPSVLLTIDIYETLILLDDYRLAGEFRTELTC